MERAKCTLKTVCDHKELNDTDVLAHVMEDATKFILASSEVQAKFAHLNHVGLAEGYLDKVNDSYSDYAVSSSRYRSLLAERGLVERIWQRSNCSMAH